MAGLLILGVTLRLGWIFTSAVSLVPFPTESQFVAATLATTGNFADAFRPGSGPTAHLSPLMPGLVSLVYRVWGVASPVAELALSLLSIGLITASFFFVNAMARELAVPRWARLAALAVVTLVPLQLPLEVRELRAWEAPLVVAVVSGVLMSVVRFDRTGGGWRTLAWLIVPGAILFVASPPASLTVFAVIGLAAVRRLPRRQWPVLGALAIAATIMVALPWALRNERVMGRMIWTRSNQGLELGVAYNDTMLHVADQRVAYLARLADIHPHVLNGKGYDKMQAAGGELAYYDQVGAEARRWITSHPGGTLILGLRHLREYLVPPQWFFFTWGDNTARHVEIRRWLLALPLLVTILGTPILIARDRRFVYPALAVALLAAPYVVFQPILRYRYLTSTLVVFLAFAAVATAVQRWQARAAPPRSLPV